MISSDELLVQADALDLNQADVQRDYVFGWLISGIFQTTTLGRTAVLKGGNALRKGYFPATRFSDDLDLSLNHGVDGDHVLTELNEVCRFVHSSSGVQFDFSRNRLAGERQIDGGKHVFKFRLYFKDMLAGRDH